MHQIHINYATASVLSVSPVGISLDFVFSVKVFCNGKNTWCNGKNTWVFMTEHDDIRCSPFGYFVQ